jgi:hypothetical protein
MNDEHEPDYHALCASYPGLSAVKFFLYKSPAFGVYLTQTSKFNPMKKTSKFAGLAFLTAGLALNGCAKKHFTSWTDIKDPAVAAQLQSFVAEKEAQANASTNETTLNYAPFFAAARAGDWPALNKAFIDLRDRVKQGQNPGTKTQDVMEIWGAFEFFGEGDPKYSAIYANDIIGSIPPGSIYFGGTDPGRFLVTAMQKSQIRGDPFFTLSQNPLTDDSYLDYLRSMYGDKIYIPTAADWQKCFDDYYRDFQKRQATHQLQAGESITNGPDGKTHINSYTSLLQVRALLTRMIFDHNTNQQFYVEESFPLEWMYPYLEPHGLILKLNHQPLPALPDDIVQQDHAYWTNMISLMIGNWLNEDTSIKQIADFTEKVYLRNDFTGFTGDTQFVENAYSRKAFSQERSSIADLYAWRAQNTADPGDKQRLNDAADFAFRQSWALCPFSIEAVFRYVQLLMDEKRIPDAIIIAETAEKMAPDQQQAEQLEQLAAYLKQKQIQ